MIARVDRFSSTVDHSSALFQIEGILLDLLWVAVMHRIIIENTARASFQLRRDRSDFIREHVLLVGYLVLPSLEPMPKITTRKA
jgi:hypothetical protein